MSQPSCPDAVGLAILTVIASDGHRGETAIRALLLSEAAGRIDALVAVLALRTDPDDHDLAWARLPAHSLVGLLSQADEPEAGAAAAELARRLDELAALVAGTRAVPAAALAADLRALRDELPTESTPPSFPLDWLAAAAGTEVARLAAALGVGVTSEIVCPDGIDVPRERAGPVVEALGNILRHGVAAECARGGAVRIGFRAEPDGFSITVGNRGNAASRDQERGGSGAIGFDAAASRLSAAGCQMAVSDAPWGGTSVTVHVPLRSRRRARWG